MSENQSEIKVDEKELSVLNKSSFGGGILLIGILLPAFTFGFEIFTGICSQFFLNPIPTFWHYLLVGFVPIANVYLLFKLWSGNVEHPILLGWVSMISTGVALFYSFVFLPVLPISIIGIIVYGLGFLGIAPMFAFLASYLIRRKLRKVFGKNSYVFNWKGTLVGFLIVFSIIAISESKFLITKHGMELVSSESVENQKKGLDIIRKYGDTEYLLKLSKEFGNNFYISDTVYAYLKGTNKKPSGTKASEIFYRLEGKSSDNIHISSGFWFDESINRSWQNRELSLYSSVMDGSIDNDASLGYLEWTFEIQNNNKYSNGEAIGQIQLPSDAVVSRLTLWINGEEREAAYAERNKVTQAYEKVVSSQRDPVLVTTAGKDLVDMKCFPILSKGGIMKVKIGITFPLILENKEKGMLKLPYFRDKNFKIANDFEHKIAILSTNKLETTAKDIKFELEDRFFVMRGAIPESDFSHSKSTITVLRSADKSTVWSNYDDTFIKQEIIENKIEKPNRFVFVIDTSVSLKSEKENIISAINSLPKDSELGLILTHGNGLNTDDSYPNSFLGSATEIADKVKQAEFGGGTDNLPALTKAWEVAKEAENGVVIWIHSPQPLNFVGSDTLFEKLVRRSNQTSIYNFRVGKGFDEIEKKLVELNFLKNIPRFGELNADLNRLFLQLNQSKTSFKYVRTIDTKAKETIAKKTSKHMIRLWAFYEINEVLASEKDERPAIDLAVKYQLVTPVTGAVVLETQKQFDDAGLNPVKKSVVHAVPEPETYLLMIIGLVAFLWLYKREV